MLKLSELRNNYKYLIDNAYRKAGSISCLAHAIGVKEYTAFTWVRYDTKPELGNLIKLANYLDIKSF